MKLPPKDLSALAPRGRLRRGLEWLRTPAIDRRPVAGVMASHVGAQHDLGTLASTSVFEMTDRFDMTEDTALRAPSRADLAALSRVRSFELPRLIGSEVRAAGEAEFPAALAAHLCTSLGTAWSISEEACWPLRKLLFFAAELAAPSDETTGAPMVLQLYGPVVDYDGVSRGTPAWEDWIAATSARVLAQQAAGESLTPLSAPFTVRIDCATYANCLAPAVGMPFFC